MLRVSKLTDYSTVIMAYMARRPDAVFSVAETAVAVGVAAPTASKILKMLARANLVQSRRGINGGYALTRAPGRISIAEVIEAMEGSLGVTECSAAAGLCQREEQCRIRDHWQGINRLILNTLAQVTLSDLVQARPFAAAGESVPVGHLPMPGAIAVTADIALPTALPVTTPMTNMRLINDGTDIQS